MASYRTLHLVLFFLMIAASLASSSTLLFQGEMRGAQLQSRRPRPKKPKPCPVDFKHKNYTNMTRNCKKPYQPDPCCHELQKIACPHMVDINDMSTDCALAMFASIDFHGNYPLGLFFKMCNERKNGMECDDD